MSGLVELATWPSCARRPRSWKRSHPAWGRPAHQVVEQPGTRLKNLDALRSLLEQYYESCAALSKPVTLSGSLRFLADADSAGSENFGDDVVNVLTYHKAKGLEWPAVVLASLDTEVAAKPWDVAVEGVDEIDVHNPLTGRWIRFWPGLSAQGVQATVRSGRLLGGRAAGPGTASGRLGAGTLCGPDPFRQRDLPGGRQARASFVELAGNRPDCGVD